MPSGETHKVAAIAAGTFVAYKLHIPIEGTVAAILGGLWPDTDTQKSILGRFIPLWLFFKHRAFTHSWLGLAVFTTLFYALTGMSGFSICFAAGYLSHIALDFNVAWLWPLNKKKRR